MIRIGVSFYMKHIWLVLPLFGYLLLFLMHKKVQQLLGISCESNFIISLDKFMFGATTYSIVHSMQHWSLDLICALVYLTHYILPFLYIVYLRLYKRDPQTLLIYVFSFGLVNFVCVLCQYIVPTPPPWMFLSPARSLQPEANFANVDSLLHMQLFKRIYASSPLVCGAFPSVHTAWPSVILFLRPWISRTFARIHVGLIAFAAVYSGHHYFIDVIFGLALAWAFTRLSMCLVDKLLKLPTESKTMSVFSASSQDRYMLETLFILKLSVYLLQHVKKKLFNEEVAHTKLIDV